MLLAGEGGSPPVKLSEQDAQKIQQHTGMPPEQLEDADLHTAMQELNIQSQPLTAEDQAALSGQPAPAAAAPQPPAAAPAAPAPASIEAQLQQLAGMRDKGLISQADYDAKKKQLLGL